MRKLNLFVVSGWCKDWDVENVKGPPITAFVIQALLKRGHKITWIAPQEQEFEMGNFRVLNMPSLKPLPSLPVVSLLLHPFIFKKNVKTMVESLNNIEIKLFDGIIAYGREAMFAVDIISRKFNIPYMARIYGLNNFRFYIDLPVNFFTHYEERHYKDLSAKIFVIDDDGTFPCYVFGRIGINNYTVLPHSGMKSCKNSREVRKLLKIPESAVVLGYVGNFSPLKGTHFLKYVIPEIIKRLGIEKVKILIIGDGSDRDIIQKLIERYPNNILWTGKIPYKQVIDLYPAMDFLLHFAIYSSCTLPVIEAIVNNVIPVVLKIDKKLPPPLEEKYIIAVPKERIKEVPLIIEGILRKNKLSDMKKKLSRMRKRIPPFERRVNWEVRLIEEIFS